MSLVNILKRKEGVIIGDDVLNLFKYAKAHNFAIPAINVPSSSAVVATLEAAHEKRSPIILQLTPGGCAFFAGKSVTNVDYYASVKGAIAAAHYIRSIALVYGIPVILHTDHCPRHQLSWLDGMFDADEEYFAQTGEPLFSGHMIDLSEEPKEENIAITKQYLERGASMKLWIEMEIGVTGEEDDGLGRAGVDKARLYTQPEDVYDVFSALSSVCPYFSIAAAFGNVHGIYKPGHVKLRPELLGNLQDYTHYKIGGTDDKPLFLVFHGGSGSDKKDFEVAISHGVVKVNIDTDLQYTYLTGVRNFILSKKEYLMEAVGNPEGEDIPNKAYFDPRIWLREGEKAWVKRVGTALDEFNCTGQL